MTKVKIQAFNKDNVQINICKINFNPDTGDDYAVLDWECKTYFKGEYTLKLSSTTQIKNKETEKKCH